MTERLRRGRGCSAEALPSLSPLGRTLGVNAEEASHVSHSVGVHGKGHGFEPRPVRPVCLFPRAAETKYHKQDGLAQQEHIVPH